MLTYAQVIIGLWTFLAYEIDRIEDYDDYSIRLSTFLYYNLQLSIEFNILE